MEIGIEVSKQLTSNEINVPETPQEIAQPVRTISNNIDSDPLLFTHREVVTKTQQVDDMVDEVDTWIVQAIYKRNKKSMCKRKT